MPDLVKFKRFRRGCLIADGGQHRGARVLRTEATHRWSSRCADEASAVASTGREWIASRDSGFRNLTLSILGPNSALLSEPNIRARCCSSARWDLCGGG